MPTPVRLPNLGAETTEALVSAWLKKVGDPVTEGEAIAELETAKATVELEAPVAGRLIEILVIAGEEATVGDVVAVIADD